MNAIAPPTLTLPGLNADEYNAGIIFKDDGSPSHWLILLPGDADPADWDTQVAWAKSVGGELPTCQEQALLYANCKQQFERDWYWSGEQHASHSGGAWFQSFLVGYQNSHGKSAELRARAVRRLVIE